jgi:hypothetical protein
MVEEEPAAVVAIALSHFSMAVPCHQQFDCGKDEGAARVLKFVKRQRPGKPEPALREPVPRSSLTRGRLHDFQRSRRVSAPRILGDEDQVDGCSQRHRLIDHRARPFRVYGRPLTDITDRRWTSSSPAVQRSPRSGKISPKAEAPYIERSDDPAGAFFSARAIFSLAIGPDRSKTIYSKSFYGSEALRQ